MTAVGSLFAAAPDAVALCTGAELADFEVESVCAALSREVETIRTSVGSRVRMGAPGSILANFNCTTVDTGLSVESRASPPGHDAAAGARGGRARRPPLHFTCWPASRGSPVR